MKSKELEKLLERKRILEQTKNMAVRAVSVQFSDAISNTEDSIKREMTKLLGDAYDLDQLHLSETWECEESPTGFCVQDIEDSEYSCIFCHQPDERK